MGVRKLRFASGSRAAPWAAAVLALCGSSPAVAQQASVQLEVGRTIATVGEPLEVTVHITIEGRSGYEEYFPPVMDGFQLAGNAMTSQNIEVINWRIRQRETHVHHAIPTRAGRLTIGPAAIRVGGRTVKSQRVVVAVQPGPSGSTAVPPDPSDPDPSDPDQPPPDQPTRPGQTRIPADGLRSGVFIGVSAAPDKVYVGEQLVAVWRLYTQSDVLGYQPGVQPSTEGFWSEDLRTPQRLDFEREVLQGRVFYAAVVWRKALFPQQPGTLTVGPLSAQVRTLQQFARPSGTLRSPPLQVEVLPLPRAGRPKDFAPQNVGQYQIAALVDRQRVKAGEAVQLSVVVRGRGNLPQLKVSPLEQVPGFKVYDPKVTERLTRDDGLAGEKTIEYLLLATQSGELEIPSVHLDYFDPAAESYERVSTEPLKITVTGKLPGAAAGSSADGAHNVLGPDIRPPRKAGPLSHRRPYRFLEGLSLWLFGIPVVLFFGVTGAEVVRARLRRQTARTLSRQIARRVRQHLRAAAAATKERDAARCYGEISAAIQVQLGERLDRRVEGLTRQELVQAMLARGFDQALVEAVAEELDSADFGRFAGSAATAGDLHGSVERARELLRQLVAARLPRAGAADGPPTGGAR